MEGCALRVERAPAFQPGVRFGLQPLAQREHQPRLADSGRTLHQQRLAFAVEHALPAVEQDAQLLLPADEGRAARLAVAPIASISGRPLCPMSPITTGPVWMPTL